MVSQEDITSEQIASEFTFRKIIYKWRKKYLTNHLQIQLSKIDQ